LQPSVPFVGAYEHSLDSKGRLVLPVKFRAAFAQGAWLSQYKQRCLALWTPEQFARQLDDMEAMLALETPDVNRSRFLAAGSLDVEVDKQGRLPIPKVMRDYARLDGSVLITGAINRLEIWHPPLWARWMAPTELAITEEDNLPPETPARPGAVPVAVGAAGAGPATPATAEPPAEED
jgi:MraZ protein